MATDRPQIEQGLRALGLSERSTVVVHSSLRSFGHVDGGANAVADALVAVCRNVVVPSGTWDDHCGIPAPPALERPNNSAAVTNTWEEFDAALEAAVPFSPDLPIDKHLGAIPEALRTSHAHSRSTHPLIGFLAVGKDAREITAQGRLDWPLGPLEVVEALDGFILLLGVGHTANTTIHLAEQRLGRSRFYRYAKAADGVWMELPNVPGQSHRFGDIDVLLEADTRTTEIGRCRARTMRSRRLVEVATGALEAEVGALLCEDDECRCGAARRQREEWLVRG